MTSTKRLKNMGLRIESWSTREAASNLVEMKQLQFICPADIIKKADQNPIVPTLRVKFCDPRYQMLQINHYKSR